MRSRFIKEAFIAIVLLVFTTEISAQNFKYCLYANIIIYTCNYRRLSCFLWRSDRLGHCFNYYRSAA